MERDSRFVIAEQAQRIINWGTPTPDTEVRIEELLIYVDQSFSKMIKASYFENRQDGIRDVNGAFLYSFIVDVAEDKMRGMLKAKIPSAYVNLPLGTGIYQVSQVNDMFNTIIPVNVSFLALSRGLKVGSMEGRQGYFVENTSMFFVNIKPSDNVNKVLIKLAGGIQGELDPEVEIPVDMQADLVGFTVQMYMQQRQAIKDDINDNNKN